MKTDRKMVLVIDEPENCDECPLENMDYLCCVTEGFCVIRYSKRRHPDCPLRPLPEKLPTEGKEPLKRAAGYACGWNDCLKEITGKEVDADVATPNQEKVV